MVTLPEEAERLAVVDIRHVHVNHHTHGQVVRVLVLVLISIHVVEPVIVPVVGQLVVENMRFALALLNINGREVVVIIAEIVINMLVR